MEDNPYGEYGASQSEADWRSRSREGVAERWSHFQDNQGRRRPGGDRDEKRSFGGPDQGAGPRRPYPRRPDEYGMDDAEARGGERGYSDWVGNANQRYISQGYPEYEARDTQAYHGAYRGEEQSRGDADSHRGKGPKSYRRSDERIREDVNDRLTEDHRLDASDIDVLVQDGEVTLNGFVDSREAKRRAEDLADRCSGVGHVQNNLRARPREARQATTNGTAGSGENLILDRIADGKSHLQPD